MILLLEFTIDNLIYDESISQRAKNKITKNNTFVPRALQSIFVECYSKEIKTAPKLKTPLIRTGV